MRKKKRNTRLPDDAELLEELATLDEVEAWVPTAADHDSGRTPQWSEIILTIKREADSDGPGDNGPGTWPLNYTMPLRRHDGELIIEVLHQVLHPRTERQGSAVAGIWSELDAIVDKMQRRIDRDKDPLKSDVNIALGLATALAYLVNPNDPDVDMIRSEAMERYDERNPE